MSMYFSFFKGLNNSPIRSLDSLISFSSVSVLVMPSLCACSSSVALCTRFLTSLFILET